MNPTPGRRSGSVRSPSRGVAEPSQNTRRSSTKVPEDVSTDETGENEGSFTYSEDEHFKVKDIREALERLKSEKQVQSGLIVSSPFSRRVRSSPLPRTYRGGRRLEV